MTFKRNFLSYLAWSCRSLCTNSRLCFWSSFSRQDTNIAAIHFTFVSVVKMCYHAPYDKPRMLRIPLILGCLSSSMNSCSFSTFFLVQLMLVSLNFQNPQPKVGLLETCVQFRDFWSTHGIITTGFLKHFVSLRS
jgi:hypothetical protein